MPDYNVSTYTQTPPAAGENLYGWTDSSLETQLYGWAELGESLYAWTYRGSDVYTHSPTPLAGDYIYNADGTVVSNNPQVEEDSDGSTMYDGYNSWSRDSANDIIGTDTRYYTTSTTLTVGMALYNENGTDTGLVITRVNQDGTFEVNQVVSDYRDVLLNDDAFTNTESREILQEIENLGGFSNISASSLGEMFDDAMESYDKPINSWYIAIADVSASNTEFTFQEIPGGYEGWSNMTQGLKLAYVTTDDNYPIVPISLFYTPTYAPITLFNSSETTDAYTRFANDSVTLDLIDVANILFNIDALTNDGTNYEFINILDNEIDTSFDSATGIFTIENIVDNYVMIGNSLDYLNCFLYLTDGTDSVLYSDLEGGHYYLDYVQVKCPSFIGL